MSTTLIPTITGSLTAGRCPAKAKPDKQIERHAFDDRKTMLIGHRDCQAGEGITNKVGTVAQGGRARNGGYLSYRNNDFEGL